MKERGRGERERHDWDDLAKSKAKFSSFERFVVFLV